MYTSYFSLQGSNLVVWDVGLVYINFFIPNSWNYSVQGDILSLHFSFTQTFTMHEKLYCNYLFQLYLFRCLPIDIDQKICLAIHKNQAITIIKIVPGTIKPDDQIADTKNNRDLTQRDQTVNELVTAVSNYLRE